MADANIYVTVNGRGSQFVLRDMDFDEKRDKLALEVGRAVIDAAYSLEGGKL